MTTPSGADVAEYSKIVGQMPLWPELTAEEVKELVKNCTVRTFKKGETLMKEGEMDGHLLIIVSGQADVYRSVPGATKPDGKPETVRLVGLRQGDYAGVGSLLEGVSHSASVVAAEDVKALDMSKENFEKLIKSNPEILLVIIKALNHELRHFRSRMAYAIGKQKGAGIPRMAVFDFKGYEDATFKAAVQKFNTPTKRIEVEYFPVKLGPQTARLAEGADVVCIFVNDNANAEVLTALAAGGTKMMALRCAGFNQTDLKALNALEMWGARVPAYSPYAVAEHAVALLMAINRRLVAAYDRTRDANFTLDGLVGFDVFGKTVGVVGTGKIGQCFINIMIGFGCNILCYDVYKNKDIEANPKCKYVELDELWAKSDIISLHCPLFPNTKYIVNKDSIAKMKDGVVLLNTSRGPLINTKDLIDGLKSKKIGGAGLDVYEEEGALFFEDHSLEPLSDDVLARLMTFPNVFVTGHQAFLTKEALDNIANTTMNNVGEWLEGKKPLELTNNINKEYKEPAK